METLTDVTTAAVTTMHSTAALAASLTSTLFLVKLLLLVLLILFGALALRILARFVIPAVRFVLASVRNLMPSSNPIPALVRRFCRALKR